MSIAFATTFSESLTLLDALEAAVILDHFSGIEDAMNRDRQISLWWYIWRACWEQYPRESEAHFYPRREDNPAWPNTMLAEVEAWRSRT